MFAIPSAASSAVPGPERSSIRTPAITQKILHLSSLVWILKLRSYLNKHFIIIIQSVYTFFRTPCIFIQIIIHNYIITLKKQRKMYKLILNS